MNHTLSKYGRTFDSNCPYWMRDRKYNLHFLSTIQDYFNAVLKHRGYLFLRDVYEYLGFPITRESVVVGWIYKEDNTAGDNFVDFNIPEKDSEGESCDIPIDFNVDGIILDHIGEES